MTRTQDSSWTGGYLSIGGSPSTFADVINFDAHEYNTIYQDTHNIVAPASLLMCFAIKY